MTRLHRFFIKETLESKKDLSIKDIDILNQWRNVLRLKSGSKAILFDDSGNDFLFSIKNISKKSTELKLVEKQKNSFKPKIDLLIAQSIIKKDNFELILEKITEIGVQKIVAIISERSVKIKLNLERSKKIIQEAAEQSGKSKLPEITEPIKFSEFIKNREEGREYFALDPTGQNFFQNKITSKKIGVFIGPEGGFTKSEIDILTENKIPVFSLGDQILRAETAAISITSILQLAE